MPASRCACFGGHVGEEVFARSGGAGRAVAAGGRWSACASGEVVVVWKAAMRQRGADLGNFIVEELGPQ